MLVAPVARVKWPLLGAQDSYWRLATPCDAERDDSTCDGSAAEYTTSVVRFTSDPPAPS